MARNTVPQRSLATSLNLIVCSREVGSLIEGLDRSSRMGRPGYGSRALIGVCIARSLYGLPDRGSRVRPRPVAMRGPVGEKRELFPTRREA